MVKDLFPEPPSIAGNIYVRPATNFPTTLEQPAAAPPTLSYTPVTFAEVFFAPVGLSDATGAVFLGLTLMLGPDFLLAPAGLVSARGLRPGRALENVLGSLLGDKE